MTTTAKPTAVGDEMDTQGKPVLSWNTLIVPVLCAVVLVLLYVAVQVRTGGLVEENMLRWSRLRHDTIEQIYISMVIAVLVLLVAIPLGILVTRRRTRWMAPFVLALGNLGQSAPALGYSPYSAVIFSSASGPWLSS